MSGAPSSARSQCFQSPRRPCRPPPTHQKGVRENIPRGVSLVCWGCPCPSSKLVPVLILITLWRNWPKHSMCTEQPRCVRVCVGHPAEDDTNSAEFVSSCPAEDDTNSAELVSSCPAEEDTNSAEFVSSCPAEDDTNPAEFVSSCPAEETPG